MKRIWVIGLLLLLSAAPSLGADEVIGVVKTIKGGVGVERNQNLIPLKINDKILEKDKLITESDGAVGIIFRDNSLLSLGPSSQFVISLFAFNPAQKKVGITTKLIKGTLTYLTGLIAKLNHNQVRFETRTMVCGVRGTHFAISESGN